MSLSGPRFARDIMATKLVTLSPETDVHEAVQLLLKNRISGASVIDGQRNVVGILSEKDYMQVLIAGAYDNLPTTTVAAFMSKEVRSITEETDLLSIAKIFQNCSYRRLPVVRDGKLVGQVSRRDLLQAVSNLLKATP